jgi:hypothetical protein
MKPEMIRRFARTALIIFGVAMGGTMLSAYVLATFSPLGEKLSFGQLMARWLYSYWWYFAMTSLGGGYFSAYQWKRMKEQEHESADQPKA